MHATLRRITAALALASAIALFAAAPVSAQDGSVVPSTGPEAPLTLGTTASADFTAMGGGSSTSDFEPLPSTGGGEIAFAAGSLLAAGGIAARWIARKR